MVCVVVIISTFYLTLDDGNKMMQDCRMLKVFTSAFVHLQRQQGCQPYKCPVQVQVHLEAGHIGTASKDAI